MKARSSGEALLITVEEAARRLCIGRANLYQHLRRGTIPSVTIGRCRRIAVRDLEDFIDRLREHAANTNPAA